MTASDKGSLGLEVGEESQGDSKSTAAAHRTLLDLPYEILTQVAAQLRPRVHPSLFPHPKAHSLDVTTITIPSNAALVDLINFAYISRKCYIAALPAIYHSLVLNTNRQVWLLAQSLTQRYQTKTDDLERYNGLRMPRHLFLTNDGLKMANDQLADQAQWAPSLRTIFRGSCHRLESIVIGTRPDGASLSEFLDPEVRATPKRVTILNFFASPAFSMYSLRPLSMVTHLHFINLVPRDPILDFLGGTSRQSDPSTPHPIQVLRISQLHAESLHDFADYIQWRHASEQWESQPWEVRRRQMTTGAPPPERPRGPTRRFEAQETLLTLARHSCKMPSFRRLVLELGELQRLPEPEDLPLLGAEMTASADATTTPQGSLATTNASLDPNATSFDSGGDTQARTAMRIEAERSRTAPRDAYWIEVRAGKEALQDLFRHCRSESTMASSDPLPDVEVRVVAPKPGGWDQNECRQDYEAQAQACHALPSTGYVNQSGPHVWSEGDEDDGTCFSDPDVFWLAEQRPWLSYDGPRREGWTGQGGDWRPLAAEQGVVEGRLGGAWWTGSLPRFDAARMSEDAQVAQ